MKKTFRGDIEFFYNKLVNKENFAITRYGDGEMIIMTNRYINLLNKNTGEFKYDPKDKTDSFSRDELLKSFQHSSRNYFVGLPCSCCVGSDKFEWMKESSHQSERNLTWANIFVNSNYHFFMEKFIPIFDSTDTYIVCNKHSDTSKLPFGVKGGLPVGTNAWKEDYHIIDELKKFISDNDIENSIFLFAAGPFANILVYELHSSYPNNTYLNIGSTLDSHLGLGKTRGYLNGAETLEKVCIWN